MTSSVMQRFVILASAFVLAACGDSVGPPRIVSIDVTSSVTTIPAGQSLQLTATAYDANGAVVTGEAFDWSSSAESVATVSNTGLVSTLTSGIVAISARIGTIRGSLPLTVTFGTVAAVSMPGFSFVPFTTNIRVGESVLFDFPAEAHNVIFNRITGAPTDILATTNQTVSRTFNLAGTFPYDCTLHPGMSGTIAVSQ
jgi:plastocyanin